MNKIITIILILISINSKSQQWLIDENFQSQINIHSIQINLLARIDSINEQRIDINRRLAENDNEITNNKIKLLEDNIAIVKEKAQINYNYLIYTVVSIAILCIMTIIFISLLINNQKKWILQKLNK